ncbi:MAG: GatB/YqeY domain-containing protein [Dehalococcoidia bacterium]|nr:GatB/YqeY domain-containing protein [Dehalococcoidia bacterium]
MSLEANLRDDLKDSMRKRDVTRTGTLRMVLSAVGYAQMAKQAPMEDSDVLGVISKEAKQRLESIEAFKKGDRPDLVAIEQAELEIIQAYLPKQMSHEEVVTAARAVIAATGAKGLQDKAKVMPKLVAELKGKADGREINTVVTELLSGK